MNWKRLVVLIAAALCTTCGAVSAQSSDTAPEPSKPGIAASLDELGLCGPIHEALLKFGPRDIDGALDTTRIQPDRHPADVWKLILPAPDVPELVFADHGATTLELFEFKGALQSMIFRWRTSAEETTQIYDAAEIDLSLAMGPPHSDNDGDPVWSLDSLKASAWKEKDNAGLAVIFACLPTEEAYFATLKAAKTSAEGPAEVSTTDTVGLPPNPWLDRSIIDVMMNSGTPLEEHLAAGTNAVGLHYENFLFPSEVPTECWWWFVDGKAVYVAADFLPPDGADRAYASYLSFKDALRKAFGAPSEDGRDEETGLRRVVYSTGPQRLVLTFHDPVGDPWYRLEIYDTTQLDKLGDELRPGRSLPQRFTPPAADSGLTREDIAQGSGAG